MQTQIKVSFLGGVASDNITGSCYLLTVKNGKKTIDILIDMGLVQCSFQESIIVNKKILEKIKPEKINHVIVTHSHIDHVGRLPLLIKHGFKGRIICTKATSDLICYMLEDSAKIQVAEARYSSHKKTKDDNSDKKKTKDALTLGNYDRKTKKKEKKDKILPLYTTKEAEKVGQFIKNEGYEYGLWHKLDHNLFFKFYASGHVMGGAIVVIKIQTEVGDKFLCFTGDLGRQDGIILPPPEFVEEPINHLITESTYGGKIHPPREVEIEKLQRLITDAFRSKKKIIIPSFALERAQELIYLLSYYMDQKLIPNMPIFLDSPLAIKITAIFADNWNRGMFSDQDKLNFNPFNVDENPYLFNVTDLKESERLVQQKSSHIVIAGSGMCDAGRIREYLRHNLGSQNTIVCLVGYMAKNSLGYKLKEKYSVVKMNHETITVNAEIVSFDSFSAHADGQFLFEYIINTFNHHSHKNKNVYIVHGEKSHAEHLQSALEGTGIKTHIPSLNKEYLIY